MNQPGVYRPNMSAESNFTIVPNNWIRATGLQPIANFLLIYFLTHEPGYELRFEQIERETGIGRHALRTALKNLQDNGWLVLERPTLPNGQLGAYRYTLTEARGQCSTVEDSTVESPTVENQPHYKKQIQEDNLKENKETKKTASYLAADWYPSEADWQLMAEHFPGIDLKLETHSFRDYWTNRNKKLIDWSKAWRNWIRNAHRFSQAQSKDESAEVLRRIINEQE